MNTFSKTKNWWALFVVALFSLTFSSCDKDDGDSNIINISTSDEDYETTIQEAFINLADGATIQLAAGTYSFTNTLSILDKDNFKILGAGMEETILDFSNQTFGAEGIRIDNSTNFILGNFKVMETTGDGIKVKDCSNLSFINVGAEWTGTEETNGAYGLYPVSSSHVLIDGCLARGASDAGIYVGQCNHAIIRNSKAENNVAGIEVENTEFAEVYGNTSTHNTGGVLVFDLPNLPVSRGGQCRVYNNTIVANDGINFAPQGNIVGEVPSGTGIMVLATTGVEIFDNVITGNNVMGIGVISYLTIESFDDPEYNPYPSQINIHDNTLERGEALPTQTNLFGTILNQQFSSGLIDQTIISDAVFETDAISAEICQQNNNSEVVQLIIDIAGPSIDRVFDQAPFDCSGNSIAPITVNAPTL